MTIRTGIAQIDTTVGDLAGNRDRVRAAVARARTLGVDILVCPELTLTGYPPEDILLRPSFVRGNRDALEDLAAGVPGDIAVVVGFVDEEEGRLYNAAAVLAAGRIAGVCRKMLLPNYGVFDEKRYFSPGTRPAVFSVAGTVFGVSICEDIWHPDGPTAAQAALGASFIVNLSASPYHLGKTAAREETVRTASADASVPFCYANLVGGQDELVFDGQSMVTDARGAIVARAPAFAEDLLVADVPCARTGGAAPAVPVSISGTKPPMVPAVSPHADAVGEVYGALATGLRDYVLKNGFARVALGLSGGIDSSLVAAIAADALGAENVLGVFMPTRYSSAESEEDARLLAGALGIDFRTVPIEPVFSRYLETLEPVFRGTPRNIAEENLQARIRGAVLMAISNKLGHLVLTTGNKSEMSAGYATLYGDMAGGFAVIKDVYKTMVYRLARLRNSRGPAIPERVLVKEPTAELRENQKDRDTLPPYDVLDAILELYIEEDLSADEIAARGFDPETVRRVAAMVDGSEYKRRQAPPGVKITPKAFGRDRRMPVTNKAGREYRRESPRGSGGTGI